MKGFQRFVGGCGGGKTTPLLFAALGLVSLTLAAGCHSDRESYREVPKGVRVKDSPSAHEHSEYGPHGGHLVELGEEEYHAEVILNPKTKDVTVYILGPDAKKPEPIDAKEVTLELTIDGKVRPHTATPSPQTGDPPGMASRFVLADDPDIKAKIADEHELEGHVKVTVKGKAYSGEIEHEHAGNDEHRAQTKTK
jgi:hypothetical protein